MQIRGTIATAESTMLGFTLMEPIELLQQRLKGKTQKQLAAELGLSVQYLADVMTRRREPGPKVLEALGLERVVSYRKAS